MKNTIYSQFSKIITTSERSLFVKKYGSRHRYSLLNYCVMSVGLAVFSYFFLSQLHKLCISIFKRIVLHYSRTYEIRIRPIDHFLDISSAVAFSEITFNYELVRIEFK